MLLKCFWPNEWSIRNLQMGHSQIQEKNRQKRKFISISQPGNGKQQFLQSVKLMKQRTIASTARYEESALTFRVPVCSSSNYNLNTSDHKYRVQVHNIGLAKLKLSAEPSSNMKPMRLTRDERLVPYLLRQLNKKAVTLTDCVANSMTLSSLQTNFLQTVTNVRWLSAKNA